MNNLELSMLARAFRDTGGYTDPEAAAVLSIPLSTFCALKNERYIGDAFSVAEIVRRLRGGTPMEIGLAPGEFALRLREYRVRYDLSQREAAIALGCNAQTLRGWEKCVGPMPLAIPELLRRLEMPVHVPAVKAAARPRPLIEPAEFATKLRAWRRRYKLTQCQCGEALGIHERTVFAWETCQQFPGTPILRRTLALLGERPVGVLSRNGRHREIDRSFGRRLRMWRKARGMNQLAAVIALGLPRDQALISDYEKGQQYPRADRLAHILAVIDGREPFDAPAQRDAMFGQRLRAWRKARRINQLAAAIALGLPRDQALISDYEKGIQYPRPERLAKIEAMIGGVL
jgi:transcriptional regulator with XRE-family HTH domain